MTKTEKWIVLFFLSFTLIVATGIIALAVMMAPTGAGKTETAFASAILSVHPFLIAFILSIVSTSVTLVRYSDVSRGYFWLGVSPMIVSVVAFFL